MTFKPGVVTNPQGNNGRTPITDSLRVILTRDPSDPLDDVPCTTAQAIALEWAKKARAGELEAIKSLTDRVEGKAKEQVEHSGNVTLETLVKSSLPKDE